VQNVQENKKGQDYNGDGDEDLQKGTKKKGI